MDKILVSDIREHFDNSRTKGRTVDIENVYSLVSHELQMDIAKHISGGHLKECRLFANCSPTFLDLVAVELREAHFAPKECIFEFQETPSHLYLIVSGAVEHWFKVRKNAFLLRHETTSRNSTTNYSPRSADPLFIPL